MSKDRFTVKVETEGGRKAKVMGREQLDVDIESDGGAFIEVKSRFDRSGYDVYTIQVLSAGIGAQRVFVKVLADGRIEVYSGHGDKVTTVQPCIVPVD